ncbi:MAG: hypothetical protein DMG93_18760 [Acidobacteria bacterium]|nr:MAG: hypothetical protein DMG93_18760 [Acidobacteriota bacterium]
MGNADMQVFNDLHIVRRNDNAGIAKHAHAAAGKPRQSRGNATRSLGSIESLQYIGRVAASAGGKSNVAGDSKINQLFGEDIVIM